MIEATQNGKVGSNTSGFPLVAAFIVVVLPMFVFSMSATVHNI
jgi:hypothetical protein